MKNPLLLLSCLFVAINVFAQTPQDWAIDVKLGANIETLHNRTKVDGGENIEHNIASVVGNAGLMVSKVTFPKRIDPAQVFNMYAAGKRAIESRGSIESEDDLLIEGWAAKRFIWMEKGGERRYSQVTVLIKQELYVVLYIAKTPNYDESNALQIIETIRIKANK